MAVLPTQYSIMVVDIEDFDARDDLIKASLQSEMHDVVGSAASSVGLPWQDLHTAALGSGILMLIPPSVPAAVLVGPFIRALNEGLAEQARKVIAARRMRFRVALHRGLAGLDEHFWQREAVTVTCLLVDAKPLRDALKAATRAQVALIVSDEVYQSVAPQRWQRTYQWWMAGSEPYLPVLVEVKQLPSMRAWVTVPGYAIPPGVQTTTPGHGTLTVWPAGQDYYDLRQGLYDRQQAARPESGRPAGGSGGPQSFRPPGPDFTPPPPPPPPPPRGPSA